jgi:hypothetical protein
MTGQGPPSDGILAAGRHTGKWTRKRMVAGAAGGNAAPVGTGRHESKGNGMAKKSKKDKKDKKKSKKK